MNRLTPRLGVAQSFSPHYLSRRAAYRFYHSCGKCVRGNLSSTSCRVAQVPERPTL